MDILMGEDEGDRDKGEAFAQGRVIGWDVEIFGGGKPKFGMGMIDRGVGLGRMEWKRVGADEGGERGAIVSGEAGSERHGKEASSEMIGSEGAAIERGSVGGIVAEEVAKKREKELMGMMAGTSEKEGEVVIGDASEGVAESTL
jgi:hypothetical protein